jgi:replicative DNA helicase
MTDMLSEALSYAARQWYVFPCREKPGEPFIRNGETIIPAEKTPYVSKGLNDATLDADQITAWWKKWPNAMIGVNAGKSGLFVVDIDRKHVNGLDTFTSWNINDSAGLHSLTPSGGMHIVFTGVGKSNTNAKTGIDTRGEGGYFVAPPSQIISGEHCGEYKRFDDWSRTPGIIPDGLMSKLFPDKTVEYVRGNTVFPEGVKLQLSRATLNFLANGAPVGERNATLFKVLADFAGCGYAQEYAKETVSPICVRMGLSMSEFEQVLIHAYSKPRTPSIPDSIQEKILKEGKHVASKITFEEQAVMENALLACLLLDNELIPVVNDVLNFEDFNIFKNRIIYRAINKLYNSGMRADYLSVSNEVAKETSKITLDELSKMINEYFINTESMMTYAAIIKEKASIRKLEAVLDNKEKYIKSGDFIESISCLEKDISDIALYGGARTTNVLTGKQASEMVSERTRQLTSGEIEQLKTGFSDYDYHVGGIFSGELIICAARSGEGKSALMLSVISDIALRQNKAAVMFSLEMSTHETVCRLICQLTGIPFKNIYQGKLSDAQWKEYHEAMARISDSKLYFDDGFGMTVREIRAKMRKLMEKDIVLVGIDQLEQVKGYDSLPPYLQFDKNAYDIKNLTKEFDIPIILNHQIKIRGGKDKNTRDAEPELADLNQAGEKPADQVWAISHLKDEKGKILRSKIILLKNRNGPKISFGVSFVGDRMLFSNPLRPEDREPFTTIGSSNTGNGENPDIVEGEAA